MPKRAGWIVPGVVAIVAAAVLVLTPGAARAVLYDGGGGGCYSEGPYYTTAPTLTPTGNGPTIRQLTVTEGTWVPLSGSCDTRVGSVTYDFYRGTTWEGSSGSGSWPSPWSGGTGHYTTGAADLNQSVKVVINACGNYMDCTTWTSPAYVPRQAPVPGTPWIGGTAQVGHGLTGNTGTWSGFAPITYAYQWQVSANGTSGWTNAPGAGANTVSYTVASADYNQYLRFTVTGTNAAGSATASSAATPKVLPAAPTGGVVSILNFAALPGATLTATACSAQGWVPSTPTPSCAYQWQVSPDGIAWTNASGQGAATASYIVAAADNNQYLRVTVTATNAGGSSAVISSQKLGFLAGPTGAVGPTGVGPTGSAGPVSDVGVPSADMPAIETSTDTAVTTSDWLAESVGGGPVKSHLGIDSETANSYSNLNSRLTVCDPDCGAGGVMPPVILRDYSKVKYKNLNGPMDDFENARLNGGSAAFSFNDNFVNTKATYRWLGSKPWNWDSYSPSLEWQQTGISVSFSASWPPGLGFSGSGDTVTLAPGNISSKQWHGSLSVKQMIQFSSAFADTAVLKSGATIFFGANGYQVNAAASDGFGPCGGYLG